MQDLVIEFLKQLNIGQLIAVGVMFWFFYRRLEGKIDANKSDIAFLRTELKGDIAGLKTELEGDMDGLKIRA